jgi:hypothetical protein
LFCRPDAYQNYVIYFDSVFKLIAGDGNNKSSTKQNNELFNGEVLKPDDSIELCVHFLRKCQSTEIESYKLRGPHLAILLLFEKLTEQGYDAVQYLGEKKYNFYFIVVFYLLRFTDHGVHSRKFTRYIRRLF